MIRQSLPSVDLRPNVNKGIEIRDTFDTMNAVSGKKTFLINYDDERRTTNRDRLYGNLMEIGYVGEKERWLGQSWWVRKSIQNGIQNKSSKTEAKKLQEWLKAIISHVANLLSVFKNPNQTYFVTRGWKNCCLACTYSQYRSANLVRKKQIWNDENGNSQKMPAANELILA